MLSKGHNALAKGEGGREGGREGVAKKLVTLSRCFCCSSNILPPRLNADVPRMQELCWQGSGQCKVEICLVINFNAVLVPRSRVFRSGHLRIFRCPIAHLRKNDFASSLTH